MKEAEDGEEEGRGGGFNWENEKSWGRKTRQKDGEGRSGPSSETQMMSFSLYHGNLRNAFSNAWGAWGTSLERAAALSHTPTYEQQRPPVNFSWNFTGISFIPCKFKNFQGPVRPVGAVNEVNYVGFNQLWEMLARLPREVGREEAWQLWFNHLRRFSLSVAYWSAVTVREWPRFFNYQVDIFFVLQQKRFQQQPDS